jgi:hypothetical protein
LSETKKNPSRSARRAWPLLVGLTLILAVALAAVLLSGERQRSTVEEQQPSPEQRPAEGEQATQSHAPLGHPSLGDSGAPVVMIEYGDFQ